jgi:hypothetical protein
MWITWVSEERNISRREGNSADEKRKVAVAVLKNVTLKEAVAFLKKSSAKNFSLPRPLSGHSLAAQGPGESKVFWLLFFKKVTASLSFPLAALSQPSRSPRAAA